MTKKQKTGPRPPAALPAGSSLPPGRPFSYLSFFSWTLLFVAFFASAVTAAEEPFSKVGVAFLEKNCTSCHGAEKHKADLTLHQFHDDLSLLKQRRKWKQIIDTVQKGDMPPDDKPQPSDADRRAFLDSARAVFANYDRSAKPDPGRVTLRRLNRSEYNNTVRDLIGLDLQPAADFPGDDVGYGFDNIGDVLSLSPVLMERYLDAAQAIAEQAMPLTPAKPIVRTMYSKYCEPAAPSTPMRGTWRMLTPGKTHIETGPLNTSFHLEATGEHHYRARVFADSPSGHPVKIALLVAGDGIQNAEPAARLAELEIDKVPQVQHCRIILTAEVTARDDKHPQLIEGTIPAMKGVERVAIALVRDPGVNPPPTLFVEYLQTEGPLDTRSPFVQRWAPPAEGKTPSQRTRELIAKFLPRAWRRPVTPEETERVSAIADTAMQRGESWEAGIRLALISILSSPKFIFRLEPEEQPDNANPHPINEFQLASRLSYFLWATCPDDELLGLAQRGQLTASLDAQVRRMLRDPRAETLTDNFAMQWLQLRRLPAHQADETVFKRWRSSVKSSMLTETRLFFQEIVREDRSILDLLDSDFTYLDRRLAELYNIQPPGGFAKEEFKRVSLAGTQRGGLLTQASILTVTSNPTRTSPVKRGKWILEQLLGDPPPPPPPNVPSLDDNNRKELSGSFRQRLEQHRSDPKCANCHAKMDTMGFALENFNAIGQWRDKNEQNQPVEVGGKAAGIELASLADLKKLLGTKKEQFARCLSEKMLIYALGRGLEYYDDRALDRIQADIAKGGYKFSALVTAIVKSDPFRLRRGKSQVE